MVRAQPLSIILIVFLVALLQGCAATVVGGAAVGTAAVHDRRSVGTVIDDQGIELKAMQMLYAEDSLSKHSNMAVTSYNYTVLLTGDAETPDIHKRFARKVAQIQNVKRVVDEVVVAPNTAFSERSHDAYLTAKAKLALFDVKATGFDPTRVKVKTHRGAVFLMGLVTRAEGNAATEEIRNVRGVKRVVKVFEYIDK